MNTIVELSTNLFDAVISVIFVSIFCKISFKKIYYSIPTIIITFIISSVFLFVDGLSPVHSIIVTIILYIYCIVCKPQEIIKIVFAPLIFELTLIVNNSFFLTLFSLLYKTNITSLMTGDNLTRYLLILGSKSLLIALLAIILKVGSLTKTFSLTNFFLYLVSPIFTVYILYVFMDIGKAYNLSQHLVKIIISVICLAIVNVFTIILFELSNRNAESKYKYDLLKKQIELERENYNALIKTNEELQKVKHDINNHLIYIKKIIDNKETLKLEEYLHEISEDLHKTDKYMVTGNRILDYILASKISENRDITFICAGDCFNLLDDFNELDIAVLFGNLIDNAIDAINNSEDKSIEIRITQFNNYININVSNSIEKSVLQNNPNLTSTKSNSAKHGWGLKSVKTIVEEYCGLFDCYENNRKFTAHICIPLNTI